MKKITLIVIILLSFSSFAQNENTITIHSYVYFQPTVKGYEISMRLPLDPGMYSRGKRFTNLSELKKEFLNSMKQKGIPSTKFSEDPIKNIRSYSGNNDKHFFLQLKTSNKEDLLKIMDTDIYFQIYADYAVIELSEKDYTELSRKGLKKSKESALIVTKQSGKQLGEIKSINIEGPNTINNRRISIMESDEEHKFSLSVTYYTK